MNKRILELAKQSGLIQYESDGKMEEVEKFAESIIEECVITALKESKWYWDKDEWESSNAIQRAVRRIKEHFGHFGDK